MPPGTVPQRAQIVGAGSLVQLWDQVQHLVDDPVECGGSPHLPDHGQLWVPRTALIRAVVSSRWVSLSGGSGTGAATAAQRLPPAGEWPGRDRRTP